MIEALMGGSEAVGPVKTVLRVLEGEGAKLKQEHLEEFVAKVLVPLKGRLEELLADPGKAELWAHGEPITPKAVLERFDPAEATAVDCYRLLGEAMVKHNGCQASFSGLKIARRNAQSYYETGEQFLRQAMQHYLDEKGDRSHQWLYDAIGVGTFTYDGAKKFTLLPLAEATRNAVAFLLAGARHTTALGPKGGTVELS